MNRKIMRNPNMAEKNNPFCKRKIEAPVQERIKINRRKRKWYVFKDLYILVDSNVIFF